MPPVTNRGAARIVAAATSVVGGLAAVTGLASVGAASYFARRVVTPESERPDDALVTALDRAADPPTVTFRADEWSTAPGRYGLWFAADTGHARIGDVLSRDDDRGEVTRELHGVDQGDLAPGPARWSGYYFSGPPDRSLGLDHENVRIAGELGDNPAWVVPAGDGERWAVLVHGRGATREETLRAVPVLHELGITALVVSYRNDTDAPASLDGRYGLGLHEWRDVDAAMAYAVGRGAQELILFGWSMGGAIVLQTLEQSRGSDRVSRVVLDGPVVDWADVIRHQAAINRVPRPVGALGQMLLGGKVGRHLIGLHEPLEIGLTHWVARADELRHPILLIHSQDDGFVPYGPSAALASARPDLVTYARWEVAEHCREWNTDPQRWERLVHDYCAGPDPRAGREALAAATRQ
ncbi:alpha/beta hydrolase family protein [Barrientosiimonas humi]|uniref:alpha/beta hydrolase family protein n=1 Tax=Barrientosiimonas humi TaxID=999931 RepID=UPI00370D88ED